MTPPAARDRRQALDPEWPGAQAGHDRRWDASPWERCQLRPHRGSGGRPADRTGPRCNPPFRIERRLPVDSKAPACQDPRGQQLRTGLFRRGSGRPRHTGAHWRSICRWRFIYPVAVRIPVTGYILSFFRKPLAEKWSHFSGACGIPNPEDPFGIPDLKLSLRGRAGLIRNPLDQKRVLDH